MPDKTCGLCRRNCIVCKMPNGTAFRRCAKPGKNAQQSRFPRTIRAGHPQQRARSNHERKVSEHRAAATFRSELVDRKPHDTARTLNAVHADASAMMQER